jgi:hypothetical protein
LLLLTVAFTGCMSSPPGPASDAPTSAATGDGPGLTAHPHAPKSVVKDRENVTKVGHEHFHDYWGDGARTEYVILDREIPGGPAGVCAGAGLTFACNGAPEEGRFVRFVSPPDELLPPHNVWPGTGKMTIEITINGDIVHPFVVAVQAPGRPGWSKEFYRVDSTQKTIVIEPILENHTDAPHNRESHWVFRLEVADNGLAQKTSLWRGTMHWRVTIHRSDRPLPLDPAHPDYWGDANRLTVLDASLWQQANYVNGASYGATKVTRVTLPENQTVFPLTHKMRVTFSWHNNQTGQPPLRMGYCDVRQLCWSTGAVFTFPEPTVSEGNTRVYELLLRSDQWDSPYKTVTAWRWIWSIDNGDLGEVAGPTGLFSGRVDYKIELEKMT